MTKFLCRVFASVLLGLLSACGEKQTASTDLFVQLASELDAAKTVLAGVTQPSQAAAARDALTPILDRMDSIQSASMERTGGSDNASFKTWQASLAALRAELARMEKASPEAAREMAPTLARLRKYF